MTARPPRYRLFSWEHSYFSGKVRAFLRYKAHFGALEFEDVLATPELIAGLLLPATQTNVVPQLLAPDGSWVQDSSEIIDHCERAHPEPAVIPPADSAPKQRLVSHLIELLADEWMVVYAFLERWLHSLAGVEPGHAAFNEQQWGAVFAAGADGATRRQSAQAIFAGGFGVADGFASPRGIFAGLVALGASERMIPAWRASNQRVLELLEAHFSAHDYVLGGLPSLADFGLLGPLYAHLYRDPVAGFELRTRFPLVSEWVERANHSCDLNARSYAQRLYSLGPARELVGRPATSDGGAWLPGDRIAPTLLPLLEVFFREMWPVLKSELAVLRAHLASGRHPPGGELPGKTFTPSPGFEALQTGEGPLTHEFELGGLRARRMVVPYHVWMLQRLAGVIRDCSVDAAGRAEIEGLLGAFPAGAELLDLETALRGCRVRKLGGRIFACAP